jgi:hypothetical protein
MNHSIICANCGRTYGEHARGALEAKPDRTYTTWYWSKDACPISDQPFHPTQTFEEVVETPYEELQRRLRSDTEV